MKKIDTTVLVKLPAVAMASAAIFALAGCGQKAPLAMRAAPAVQGAKPQ